MTNTDITREELAEQFEHLALVHQEQAKTHTELLTPPDTLTNQANRTPIPNRVDTDTISTVGARNLLHALEYYALADKLRHNTDTPIDDLITRDDAPWM